VKFWEWAILKKIIVIIRAFLYSASSRLPDCNSQSINR